MTAKEYRSYAAECMEWAKTARSDQERNTFLEMAKTWLQAATVADRASLPSVNGAIRPSPSVSTDPHPPQSQSPQPDQ